MTSKTKRITAAVLVAGGLAGGAAAIASAGGDDDGKDKAIKGHALSRATRVALQATGGGKVSETERGDEESYYQVEVTKADGSRVDVNLDRAFNVVRTKTESGSDD
jgi:uncharacterized membrane protein YkoI